MKAYIVEPVKPGMSWKLFSEETSRRIVEVAHQICEKYPEVTIVECSKLDNTELINILVIHVPDTLSQESIEEEFSCGLLPVKYEESKSS